MFVLTTFLLENLQTTAFIEPENWRKIPQYAQYEYQSGIKSASTHVSACILLMESLPRPQDASWKTAHRFRKRTDFGHTAGVHADSEDIVSIAPVGKSSGVRLKVF